MESLFTPSHLLGLENTFVLRRKEKNRRELCLPSVILLKGTIKMYVKHLRSINFNIESHLCPLMKLDENIEKVHLDVYGRK